MTAAQARKRSKSATLKHLMQGIYDQIGRAADKERYSLAITLPVEGDEVINVLGLKKFEVERAGKSQIRISWLKEIQ
jgi:hypothetical protein